MRSISVISLFLLLFNMQAWAVMPCCLVESVKESAAESQNSCGHSEQKSHQSSSHDCTSGGECAICSSESNQSEKSVSFASFMPLIISQMGYSTTVIDLFKKTLEPLSIAATNYLEIPGEAFSSIYPLRI